MHSTSDLNRSPFWRLLPSVPLSIGFSVQSYDCQCIWAFGSYLVRASRVVVPFLIVFEFAAQIRRGTGSGNYGICHM